MTSGRSCGNLEVRLHRTLLPVRQRLILPAHRKSERLQRCTLELGLQIRVLQLSVELEARGANAILQRIQGIGRGIEYDNDHSHSRRGHEKAPRRLDLFTTSHTITRFHELMLMQNN